MVKYRFEQIAINSTEKKKPVEEDRFTYLGLEHLDSGSLKVTRFGSEVAPIGEKLVMHKGDVLFGKRRAYQKKVAIAPFDGIFSAHGMVLRPREDVIDKSFFPLFISSDYFLDAAIKISVGSLSPTINWRDLKTLEFELPDLATQRKLAETLWSINDTMETYKKLIAATDELVKSQFMELFGDPVTNTQGREVRPFKDFMLDIRYGTSQPPTFNELGEFKFIRATNIKAGRITENGMLRISADEAAKIEKCRLNGNEIIIVRSGANTGDTCVVTDEYRDQYRNRIPAILQAVDAIVLTGVIDDSIEINFNVNQIQEEKKKIEFLTQNPDCTDEVFELEDHNMLKGQIGIIGLDNLSLGSRFSSLFACSWDKIDCALMTLGNYGQQERNKWRYQFASKSLQYAWDELFHKSANAGFENTHTILVELLKSKESFDDGILDGIISAFLAQCEKDNLYPWNYYYVKYPVFRPGSYGKMSNDDVVNKPYMFSVMQTKTQWSQNTYMPYLKEADDDHLSRDEMGQYLVYDDVYIVCENNSYGVYRNDDDSLTDTVTISQNEAGIDTEDRIIKLKKYIANMK